MRVVWTAGALHDPNAIRAYLRSFNPVAARRIAQSLLLAGDGSSLFPSRGRVGLEPGARELAVVQPYVLVHEAKSDEVAISAVWHGAQDR